MKKTFTINGHDVTFTEIRFIYCDETTVQNGLLIHDETDEYHDGDCIIGNMCEMPETADEAVDMLMYEHPTSYISLRSDGIWHIYA